MTNNIHLIFKTHLDVGFTDYASVVIHNYFKKYIPASLRVAKEMRESNTAERFIWTTGSWLIYEYLEQASSSERKEMEDAIHRGEICWHALPFTTHTELMDVELYRFGLSLSQILDQRFGKKTIAAKLTDVPGHTRGIVPLLAEAGVKFLHIGVNPGSTVPNVPRLFRWMDACGAEIIVMIESGYGSSFTIEGLDHSLAFGHTGDNLGPQSAGQVLEVFRELRNLYPGSNVFASTLNQFAEQLEPIRCNLPVQDNEIGDTWIHGIGSDPIKVSRYRELLRLRSEWFKEKIVTYKDPLFFNFNRRLLLVPEHTWGMDEKTHLGDHESYDAKSFNLSRYQADFKRFEASWVEKRSYPQRAVDELEETELGYIARNRLASIRAERPDISQWDLETASQPSIRTSRLNMRFNSKNGSIIFLEDLQTGRQWSGDENPLGVFSYQTFSAVDYDRFFQQYIIPELRTSDWPKEDFCKPGLQLANPVSRIWQVSSGETKTYNTADTSKIIFRLMFDEICCKEYGAPGEVYLKYEIPKDQAEVRIELQWFTKPACRMPEAFWVSFIPTIEESGKWVIEKLGQRVSPLEVVENGNRHLHAADQYIEYSFLNERIRVIPLDSPLVAPGQRSLLNFNNDQPDLKLGMHFCLLNNLWGTNFPMWFEEDCRFRFVLQLNESICNHFS